MAIDPNSPLKDLYQNKNDMPVLMYPHDLGSARKGHFITFSVLIPTKSTYKMPATGVSSSVIPPSVTSLVNDAQTSFNSAATTATQAAADASSTLGSITSTIGEVASVANQALTTASQVVGTATSIAGAVSSAASSVSAVGSATTAFGAVTGSISAINSVTSAASTISNIPGVSSFLNDPMQAASNAFDSIKNFLNDPLKSISGGAPTGDQAPTDTTGPKFSPATMKPSGYINLYMPDTVSMAQHASYGDIGMTEALGALGGFMEGMDEAGQFKDATNSIYDNFDKNDIMGSTLRTYNKFKTGEIGAPPLAIEGLGAGAGAAGIVANGGAVSRFLLKKAGYALNPQFEVVFTQMDFRKFQFDFTFTPKSPEEAQTIRDIIKLFRVHSSPSNPNVESGRYFNTPSVFKIEYMHLESHNENLHNFAPCVLETVIVDYAPEVGWVAFNDGMPVKTRLTLQFKETEIITQETILSKGY
jgi:hypothetical protein